MLLFLVCLFSIYMRKPGIVVFRKLQSNAFLKLQTIFKKSLLQEGAIFRILRKHRSEACGRGLCLVYLRNILFRGCSSHKLPLKYQVRTKGIVYFDHNQSPCRLHCGAFYYLTRINFAECNLNPI